ncbi:unnamed protein product [Victoria cruziana]
MAVDMLHMLKDSGVGRAIAPEKDVPVPVVPAVAAFPWSARFGTIVFLICRRSPRVSQETIDGESEQISSNAVLLFRRGGLLRRGPPFIWCCSLFQAAVTHCAATLLRRCLPSNAASSSGMGSLVEGLKSRRSTNFYCCTDDTMP